LKRIFWITSVAGLGGNPIISFALNLLIPWNLLFTYILNQLKASIAASLPGWLQAWYNLEALNSLANFSYLNPDYVYPRFGLPQQGYETIFEARDLGHPLLRDEVKVCNDFTIDSISNTFLVTGSNMSGKSTFLRTLGVNLRLAYAGGPVNATDLRTGLYRLFTCIQVSDSLSNGISYFYAEVRRLKALLEALAEDRGYPLFFLIDEIYRGTNNEERRIGSKAYLRALASGRGAGIVSTHDLELVNLADKIPNISNFHFREEIRNGQMYFDYRLHPGPCPTTNALKIMELVGLPVDR
jgi:DNA mismatch repair ATPase MutS